MRLIYTAPWKAHVVIDCENEPSPTIAARGMGGAFNSQYFLEEDGRHAVKVATDKPPYRVPSMAEVRAVPPNGFTVASTFSGCGGSCTGYAMAGFRVAYANEFVPAAQDSYRANWPDSHLDPRDVRLVKPEEVLARLGMKKGQLDLLDGSPPCQAFSTAGKRQKGWGKEKTYEHGAKQKNETLFDEYVRLLRGIMPKVFVAENVSGLVKGVAKGFFIEIMKALKASGYRVEARMLDAQWLGVPQMRQRIIFVGVRNDLNLAPAYPKPLPYRYSVRDALALAGRVVHDTTGKGGESGINSYSSGDVTDRPCPAITNGVNGLNSCHFSVTHDTSGRREFCRGDVTDKPSPAFSAGRSGTMFIEGGNGFDGHALVSVDQPMQCVQAQRPLDVVERPLPASRKPGGYNVSEVSLDAPCPTVTIGSPGNDLAVPGKVVARRKFTIAELKRVCGFPDDYVLTGSYSQMWERLGNSVPPVMMAAVARVIRDQILGRVGK